jgi:hypothetical protein
MERLKMMPMIQLCPETTKAVVLEEIEAKMGAMGGKDINRDTESPNKNDSAATS